MLMSSINVFDFINKKKNIYGYFNSVNSNLDATCQEYVNILNNEKEKISLSEIVNKFHFILQINSKEIDKFVCQYMNHIEVDKMTDVLCSDFEI